jgi:UDP-3-O-[3-hydroxymyristoyl] N-acetylglucosamine deacetylase
MAMQNLRRTIAKEVEYEGIGLHTGTLTRVKLIPVFEVDESYPSGIVFLCDGVAIPAHLTFVKSSQRCVVLSNGDVSVSTVEHLLAALYSFGISDVHILVRGQEIPIGNGDATHWVKLLMEAGTKELGQERKVITVREPIEVRDERSGAYARVVGDKKLSVHYTFEHERPFIGVQSFFCDDLKAHFINDIAPARTFGFIEEVEELLERGLGKGGSLENCLIVFSDGYSAPLRFEDELVRHKVLDLIGDLALLGADLNARVEVYKGGHELHLQLAHLIWERLMSGEGEIQS